MPNHVTNILIGSKELYNFIKGKDDEGNDYLFDFAKVVPTPQELHLTCDFASETVAKNMVGSPLDSNELIACLEAESRRKASFNNLSEEQQKICLQMVSNHKKYGHFSWFTWNRENYGTKWNSYDCEMVDGFLKFDTAWSTPDKVFQKLAEKFDFSVIYADEDIGSNAGILKYKGGKETFIDMAGDNVFSNSVKGNDLLDQEDYLFDNTDERDIAYIKENINIRPSLMTVKQLVEKYA